MNLEGALLVSTGVVGQLAIQVEGYQWVLRVWEDGVEVVEQSGRMASSKVQLEDGRHVVVNVGGHQKELSIVCTGEDGTELRELRQTVILEEDRGLPVRVSEVEKDIGGGVGSY